MITNAQKVNMAIAYKGISKTELAKMVNISASNLCQKLTRDTLTVEELDKIAQALGASYVFGFVFPDGTKI